MDFSRNVVLKEDYAFVAAGPDGQLGGAEHGFYHRDTRYLSRYHWRFEPAVQLMLLHSPRPDRFRAHYGELGHHQQHLAVERSFELSPTGFTDSFALEVTGPEGREAALELDLDCDFADVFEVRGWEGLARGVEVEKDALGARFAYHAEEGSIASIELTFSEEATWTHAGAARFAFDMKPGERREIRVEARVRGYRTDSLYAIDYPAWRSNFAGLEVPAGYERVVQRAVEDLRALLLFTEEGPVPAAGIPWYVAPFGRDALLTAAMLLPLAPEVARGTLRHLSRYQGEEDDPFTREEPGKMMHELRSGELTRRGRMPHNPYYGTVDATPLFLVLLERYWRASGDLELVRELRPHWEAALAWMIDRGDPDGDGFLEFTPDRSSGGLSVQSWKDSPDSMSHADGTLAAGNLAVSEVQGYAYDAYVAASAFYRELGEGGPAAQWAERARRLKEAFHEAFWLEELGTYALALDGEKLPLRVHNSDAGHLLWSGIVPDRAAPGLVRSLFGAEMWSGWGFRTLGSSEVRYNPVSYHNGSVWPHDSALVALGLARYGYREEAAKVKSALLELALTQPDLRLPELVGGYGREESGPLPVPPVPYPVACRPQAWDCAAVVCLLNL